MSSLFLLLYRDSDRGRGIALKIACGIALKSPRGVAGKKLKAIVASP